MAGVPSRRFLALGAGLALVLLTVGTASAAGGSVPGRQIYMPTRGMVQAASHGARPTKSSNLYYHGGVGGSGVVTGADKVYVVYWGSQWTTGTNPDPSGEASIVEGFLSHVGGSSWNNSVTQYCQGIAQGSTSCSANFATNPTGVFGGSWYDNASAAPSKPTQSQLAAEAARAASRFGADPTTSQVVVATSHGNNMTGFGTQWCAWHSSTSYAGGNLAYTNLPYMTDAGASCGANFNGLGATAGITIVEGHEFAETETDIYPSGGWLDGSGAENGDKCAWNSATSNQTLSGGASYPVQPLWSNAANGGKGACVLSY